MSARKRSYSKFSKAVRYTYAAWLPASARTGRSPVTLLLVRESVISIALFKYPKRDIPPLSTPPCPRFSAPLMSASGVFYPAGEWALRQRSTRRCTYTHRPRCTTAEILRLASVTYSALSLRARLGSMDPLQLIRGVPLHRRAGSLRDKVVAVVPTRLARLGGATDGFHGAAPHARRQWSVRGDPQPLARDGKFINREQEELTPAAWKSPPAFARNWKTYPPPRPHWHWVPMQTPGGSRRGACERNRACPAAQ